MIKIKPEELAELNSKTKYPKIQSLWERNEKFKAVVGNLNEKLESLRNIKNFLVQEKYHGTSLGIIITPEKEIYVRKRSTIIARAIHSSGTWEYYESLKGISHYLSCFDNIDFKKILKYFEDSKHLITIFGEGVGKGIQKNWKTYTDTNDFVVFDIKCGNSFFDWKSLVKFCKEAKLRHANSPFTLINPIGYDWEKDLETKNKKRFCEGYVIKSEPPLLNQYQSRMIFKIKLSDFKK